MLLKSLYPNLTSCIKSWLDPDTSSLVQEHLHILYMDFIPQATNIARSWHEAYLIPSST